MARNVVTEAHQDVAALARDLHDAGDLARKMEQHQGSTMYLAEVAALLQKDGRWDGFKKRAHLGDLEKRAEHGADTLRDADKDAHNDQDNRGKIFLDIVTHDPLYGERFVSDLRGVGKLHNIQKIDDEAFRSRAGIALGNAEIDGLISGSDVVKVGKQAVSGGLGGNPHPQDVLTSVAAAEVEGSTDHAKSNLEHAQKQLQTLDAQLQRELREIGPAIWDPNERDKKKLEAAQARVTAYIRDFKSSARYRKAQADVKKWADALKIELQQHELDIEAHGRDPHAKGAASHARDLILDSYHDMAGTESHATDAAIWAKQHEHDPEFHAEHQRIVGIGELAQATDGCHQVQRIAEIMREGGENRVVKAIELIEKAIKPYEAAHFALKGVHELKDSLHAIREHAQTFRHAKDAAKARALATKLIHATQHGDVIVVRLGSGFGMMLSVADEADTLTVTTNFVAIGDGVKVLYERVDEFRKIADGGASKKNAGKLAAQAREIHGRYLTLSRGLSVLSIAGGALGIEKDLHELDNPAVAVKLVGDIATTVGSAMALFPPLAPIGEALSLVGSVISLIASGFVGDREGDQRRGDEEQRLVRIHAFDHGPHERALAHTFTNDDAAGELEDAQQHHLTLDQIKKLGAFQPFLFRDPHLIEAGDALRHYLSDPENTKKGRGGLVSPYKDSLFRFLMATQRSDAMHGALSLAHFHRDGNTVSKITPPDIIASMVRMIRLALPRDAFHDPPGVVPVSERP